MIDIKLIRENPELVKENIKKKFQDAKLPLVDEAAALDAANRAAIKEADELRAKRNSLSKEIMSYSFISLARLILPLFRCFFLPPLCLL